MSNHTDENHEEQIDSLSEMDEQTFEILEESAHAGTRKLVIWLFGALLLVGLMHFTETGQWIQDQLQDGDAMMAWLASGGILSIMMFVTTLAGLIAIGVPRLLLFALSGFLFDVTIGLALAMIGSMLGSFIAFRTARWAGRGWCQTHLSNKKYVSKIVNIRPTSMSVAITRMLPLSNIIINIGLAMSRVRNRAFLLGTMIGFLPQGVIAVLIGAGVAEDSLLEAMAQLVLATGLAGALAWALIRRKPKSQQGG